ncbi:MAG: radical SAM protein, partial [Gemmatimonadota bacterium]
MNRPADVDASAASAAPAAPAPLEATSEQVLDTLNRPLKNLRLSLIDKCNLRCLYCMPEEEYVWLPRQDFLSVDEIGRLIGIFADLGVDRVRLTGGEPLLRKDAAQIVARISGEPRIRDIGMTSNGVLLVKHAEALAAAGLGRITISLDTLRRDRFAQLTQRDRLEQVLEGIAAAARAGLKPLKINTV